MRVSLNQIKQFVDFELPPVDELVAKINQQLGGVQEIIDLGERYKDAVIAKVVKCEKHPNADKLSVCEIDAGTGENIEVVCGAPNVREGIFVVWLPPKSTVPVTFGDKEPFVLEPKELRGVVSNGMLASAKELGIGDSHDGILEINPDEWKPSNVNIKPGASFANAYGLDDTIIDIENKMFTHRPDLFGQLGVAREIAGIQHKQFASPEWYKNVPEFKSAEGLELEVFNETPENVPRFMAVAIKGVEVKPSPLWLQCALVAMGSKPINNIVDVTNYVMLLTAQPTHAYDYDKIRGHKIGARMAKPNEKITLLNGKTYELTEDDIVIADAEGPVGLGGIMGGGESEVDADTKNIVLEVATFDMYTARKSSMRHGVFTDALTRFNKGQSPLQNDHILSLLMMSIFDVSPGEQASDIFDEKALLESENAVNVTSEFINERLGLRLAADEIKELLENVEMTVDGELSVTPPFWRTDIELPEDIVEEVGRLYGFDKLPRELPRRSIKPARENPRLLAKRKIRESLSRSGANEALTYSFVHEKILKRAGQNPESAFRLGNALSPDLQFYRLSLVPSLLDKVHMNIRASYDEFALFEIGKGHQKDVLDEDGLPKEFDRLAAVYASKNGQEKVGAPYYQARRIVDDLFLETGLGAATYTPLVDYDLPDFEPFRQMLAPFDSRRSAVVTSGEKLVGVVGEFTSSVIKNFKLPARTSGFELFLSPFIGTLHHGYRPLSKFPSVTQDVSLKVPVDTPYQAVFDAFLAALRGFANGLDLNLAPLSIYQVSDADVKTVTLRLTVTSREKTLKDVEVATMIDSVASKLGPSLGAERV